MKLTQSDCDDAFGGVCRALDTQSLRSWRTRSLALAALSLGVCLALPHTAVAGDKLDIKQWLNRPGVKLVAVEFYATWCEACMEAIPRWKALHERYQGRGLRLIVVAQDRAAATKTLAWHPDDYVDDYDQRIARSYYVQGDLPSAFLWSWQGKLLVRRGHIDQVEREVKRYLASHPRVVVEATGLDGRLSRDLEAQVRSEVASNNKLTLVLDDKEKAKLRQLKKASHGATARTDNRCQIGAELAANSVLQARLYRAGPQTRIELGLHSAETGCQGASATAVYDGLNPQASAREAVASLIDALRSKLDMPPKPVAPDEEGGAAAAAKPLPKPPPSAKKIVVAFESNPSGANVIVDGDVLCQAPCSKELAEGAHRVSMQIVGYAKRQDVVRVGVESRVSWQLVKDEAWVTVATVPPGLAVMVNGMHVGKGTVEQHKLRPGGHTVEIGDKCFAASRKKVQFAAGDRTRVTLVARPRTSQVKVKARDGKGNDVVARAVIDGRPLGQTPNTFEVPLCSKSLKVEHASLGAVSLDLSLEESGTKPYEVVLGSKKAIALQSELRTAKIKQIAAWSSLGVGLLGLAWGTYQMAGAFGERADLQEKLDSKCDSTGRVCGIAYSDAVATNDDISGRIALNSAIAASGLALGSLGGWLLWAPGSSADTGSVQPVAPSPQFRIGWRF